MDGTKDMELRITTKIFILSIFIFSLLSVGVFAQTFVNATVVESAHQNVTFAEFFDLEENVYDANIQGWINITNPSNETVYDLMVRLDNMANLQTEVIHYDGRHGSQSSGLTTENVTETLGVINRTPQPFPSNQDLDRDNRTDFIWVNDTHLKIDLSSETQMIVFELSDPITEDAHSVSFSDEPIVSSSGEVLGWVDGSSPDNEEDQIDAGVIDIIQAPNPDYVMMHIPELRTGNYTVFTYNATADIDAPLNVTTDYVHEHRTKVLANECFVVQQNATNDFEQGLDLSNVSIDMDLQSVPWNDSTFNFTFANITETGDWQNVDRPNNRSWRWDVNDGFVGWNDTYGIEYTVCAPETVPNSSTYQFLEETLSYSTNGTITGINLSDIKARADLRFNFTKRIDEPTDEEENRNVIWESEPTVAASNDIIYNLTKTSMWVSDADSIDPNDKTELKERYYPNTTVSEGNRWNSWEDMGERWYFNYTDGSHVDAPPPIIWMIPYYHIADVEDQLITTFETRSGDDYYFKYIYVINSYWLEIEKNVTNIGENEYNVTLNVWNIGPGYTPENLTVTIYDFVPEEFTADDFSPMYSGTQSVEGSFDGTAYNWDVPTTRTPQNASFAPEGEINSTWNASYTVEGEGDYTISDLYIVGLDPRLVDGGPSSEVISVLSSKVSESSEGLYVTIVMALVVINLMNYVMVKKKD